MLSVWLGCEKKFVEAIVRLNGETWSFCNGGGGEAGALQQHGHRRRFRCREVAGLARRQTAGKLRLLLALSWGNKETSWRGGSGAVAAKIQGLMGVCSALARPSTDSQRGCPTPT
jgi:hypothetical protein